MFQYYNLIFIFSLITLTLLILILIYYFGYKIKQGNDIDFNYDKLYYKNNVLDINNVNDYLQFKESLEPYLKESSKKEIIFINDKIKSSKVIYAIHGFNADKNECKYIAMQVSNYYKYNLFLTRMPDHGIYNKEEANNSFYSYLRTIYDDLIMCSLLGNEIVIISVSTGSTYAILASVYFSNKFNIKDNIMLSPNIEPVWYVSYITKFLASGYGSFLLGLSENRIYLDNNKVSSNIFKPMIGSLASLRSVKNNFTNNCIIFTAEKDSIVSTNKIIDFFKSIKSNKKYLYIFKDINKHPVASYKTDILLKNITDYFNKNDGNVFEYL